MYDEWLLTVLAVLLAWSSFELASLKSGLGRRLDFTLGVMWASLAAIKLVLLALR